MQALRASQRELRRITERAHHVLHRGRRVVQLRHRGDRRVLPPVMVVHVVEHFFAPVHLEVDIDVGRLGAPVGAHFRQESLEQQAVTHRIDRGDAEAVRDRAVGGTAAPLAEDAALAREIAPHPT